MIFGKVSSEFSTRGFGDAGFVKSFQIGDFRLQGRQACMHSFIQQRSHPLISFQLPQVSAVRIHSFINATNIH